MQATEKIWHDCELVDRADAAVHLAALRLDYGTVVFEGMRAYEPARAEHPEIVRGRREQRSHSLDHAAPAARAAAGRAAR